jgi:hypothetical protein
MLVGTVISFFSSILFERMLILMGILLFIIIAETYKLLNVKIRNIFIFASVCILGARVFLSVYTMFIFMRFNGNDYGNVLHMLFGN